MGAKPCNSKEPASEHAGSYPPPETGRIELETELLTRKRLEQDLQHLNTALEIRLAEMYCEVAAAKDLLSRERQNLAQARSELSLLTEDLIREKNAFKVVSQELDSFCYSISHDLRSPLRHVVGFSGALLEDYRDGLEPTAQGFLDCIVRAGRKMETLIEALLKLSRIARQELKIASVDLSEIARQFASSLRESDPGRKVIFTIPENLAARADAALLRAALGNLLENAWKYTVKKEPAIIELGRKQEGETTVFFLRDNGAGFDMRYADKLFGPFQRMHSEAEFEGTGIGLATVQRIIHRHGGKIWADAAIDEGATFFFTLSG